MLALNVVDRDPAGFLEPLRFQQVAPLLFLLAEKGAVGLLGLSPMALRLVPLLAGILAVVVFGALARRLLEPLEAALATGLLAVSYYPVGQSCEVKPYSLDLLAATLLLLLGAAWLANPRGRAAPALLVLLVPFAAGFSYPSVFVAGGVSLALLPAVLRRKETPGRAPWILFNVLLVGSFVAFQLLTGRVQAAAPDLSTYWAEAFPPASKVALAGWLVSTHTGSLLAHPRRGPNSGSVVTTFLVGAGLVALARRRSVPLAVLTLAPFALTFTAAVLRRYPYGGAPRLAQHLGPSVCLLAALGLALLVNRFAGTEAARRRSALALLSGLCLFALGGMLRDVLKPHKSAGDRAVFDLVRRLERDAPRPAVVLVAGGTTVPASVELALRASGLDVRGVGPKPWAVPPEAPRIALLRFGRDQQAALRLVEEVSRGARPFAPGASERLFFPFGWRHDPPVAASLTLLDRRGGS